MQHKTHLKGTTFWSWYGFKVDLFWTDGVEREREKEREREREREREIERENQRICSVGMSR